MTNGVMDFQERTCQPATAQLRSSRDSEHKNNDISFTLDPKATKFLRGVYKYINYVLAKGYTTGFKGSTGNTDADRQQHMLSKKDNNMIAGKLHRN